MEARRRVEFTGGSGPAMLVGSGPATLVGGGLAAVAARRGKEVAPARLGEGARSAGELLVPALPRWSAHDWGCQRHCAAVSRAARASVLWLARAEATLRPPHRDARPHRSERDGGSSAVGT
jgi:hypothetical protein